MAKSNRHNTNRRRKKKFKFLLARTNILLKSQLTFQDSQDDKFVIDSVIRTTPSIALYDGGNRVMLDYSHSRNKNDLSKIVSFFEKSNSGASFTISNGKWKTPLSKTYDADFSGTYYFRNIEGNNIILADIVSDVSTSTKHNTYSPEYFIDVPQISITIPENKTKISIIKNILGNKSEKSFRSLGINENTKPNTMWVEIGGSELNVGKHRIRNYRIDSEGAEVLVIDGNINEEVFSGEGMVVVNVYVKDNEENKKYQDGPLDLIRFTEKKVSPTPKDTTPDPLESILNNIIEKQTQINVSSDRTIFGGSLFNRTSRQR